MHFLKDKLSQSVNQMNQINQQQINLYQPNQTNQQKTSDKNEEEEEEELYEIIIKLDENTDLNKVKQVIRDKKLFEKGLQIIDTKFNKEENTFKIICPSEDDIKVLEDNLFEFKLLKVMVMWV